VLDEIQSKYVIELIVQDNKLIREQIKKAGKTQEQLNELKSRLQLSDKIFKAVVTDQGLKQSKVTVSDRVLIVDDTQNMLNLMRSILSHIGFKNIDLAKDGVEAWKLIEKRKADYGLILSDWEMPNMDGMELLENVRSNKFSADTPFIISGTSQIERVKLAIAAGVTDYMVKPISQKELEEKVGIYLARTGT